MRWGRASALQPPDCGLTDSGFDAVDLLTNEPLGGARDNLRSQLTDRAVAQPLDDAPGDAIDELGVSGRGRLEGGGGQLALLHEGAIVQLTAGGSPEALEDARAATRALLG